MRVKGSVSYSPALIDNLNSITPSIILIGRSVIRCYVIDIWYTSDVTKYAGCIMIVLNLMIKIGVGVFYEDIKYI